MWNDIIVLESFMIFYMIYDCVTMIYDQCVTLCYILWQFVTVIYDIILISNLKSKNKKINENK